MFLIDKKAYYQNLSSKSIKMAQHYLAVLSIINNKLIVQLIK